MSLSGAAIYVGHVFRRSPVFHNRVKVRVIRMTLDKRLLMYFNTKRDYWAVEKEDVEKSTVGDVVLIKELPERVSPETRFEIEETIFKIGAVLDPVTGRRCRGTQFIDKDRKTGHSESPS